MCTTLCLLISETCWPLSSYYTLFFLALKTSQPAQLATVYKFIPLSPRASLTELPWSLNPQELPDNHTVQNAFGFLLARVVLSYTCNGLDMGATGKTLLNQFSNFLLLTFSGDKRCTYIFLLRIMLSEHFSVIALILHWRTASDAEGNVNTEDFKGCIVSWCKTFLKKESIPFFVIQQAWTEILSY